MVRVKQSPILEVRDLNVTFETVSGPVHAVRDLSFEIRDGEALGIVGESGSGKSVSALSVMQLLPRNARTSGEVVFRNRNLLHTPDRSMNQLRGREISMIFQDPMSSLDPIFTIGGQLLEALRQHNPSSSTKSLRVRSIELLRKVGIPDADGRFGAYPHQFSGGMRQRVLIAMAIANEPSLVIADEPTTALDVTVQAQILELIASMRIETGASLVLITHDLGILAGAVDRVLVMYGGRAVETGSVDSIFHDPRMPYTVGLLGSIPTAVGSMSGSLTPIPGEPPDLRTVHSGCPFAPRCALAESRCLDAIPALDRAGQRGHLSACIHRDTPLIESITSVTAPPGKGQVPERDGNGIREPKPILQVRGLRVHYDVKQRGPRASSRPAVLRAVDDISFDLEEGEILSLVGESGCGKSTTGRALLGLEQITAGEVRFQGRSITERNQRELRRMRREIQIVFQDPYASLNPRRTVRNIVAEPLRIHKVERSKEVERAVTRMLEIVGLRPEFKDRYPSEFSGGQRQRISIARALMLRPRVLVMDEPVSALDVSIQAGILNLLLELRETLGISLLFIAHDLSVVRYISDRVGVMYLGRIVEIGAAEKVFRDPRHPYTRALMSAVPIPDPRIERGRERIILEGDVPSPVNPPSGCTFRTRCPLFKTLRPEDQTLCISTEPHLDGVDHRVACHYSGSHINRNGRANPKGLGSVIRQTVPHDEWESS